MSLWMFARASRLSPTQLYFRCFSVDVPKDGAHMSLADTGKTREYTHPGIGDREIVGWGNCGKEVYFDRLDFPYPAIRWKSPKAPGVPALRKKEMGDWKKLTLEEKKGLYRASFCQTLVEYRANPNNKAGIWKYWIGTTLLGLAVWLWMFFWVKIYVYNPLPKSFSLEGRIARQRWHIATRKDPVQGISSHWDYEKDQWKEEHNGFLRLQWYQHVVGQ